jgi:hypothetical protein
MAQGKCVLTMVESQGLAQVLIDWFFPAEISRALADIHYSTTPFTQRGWRRGGQ